MAKSGRRKTSNRSSSGQTDSSLSSSFERFSVSLDRHSEALNSFSKQFKDTMDKFSVEFDRSSSGRDSESALMDISRSLDRSSKASEKGLSTLQKTGQSIETILVNVGSLIVGEIRNATNNVSTAYKSHLSSITSQLQMTNKEYSRMFNEASEYFRESGLNKQFSPVDYAEALESVLSTGLRGDNARQLAYQNLISNKLVPAISTNTVAYRRMSKVFGEEFNKNTVAFAKYTESIIGSSEGISEGRFDSMRDTLESQIMYAAGGNSELANKVMNQLTATLSWMEANNLDANAFINDLYSASTGQIGDASIMQAVWGAFTPEDVIDSLLSDSGVAKLTEKYLKAYSYGADNPNALVAYTNALGGDVNQAFRVGAYVKSGGNIESIEESIKELLDGYDQNSQYEKFISILQDGGYQTADDALTKQEENLMTGVATVTSSIARFDEALNAVTSTLWSLANIWLLGTARGSGGQGGSLLGSLRGLGRGSGSRSLGELSSLDGATLPQIITGSSTATASGLVIGAGGILAGTAMALTDALDSGSAAAEDGKGSGDAVLQGIRGAFTGASYMSEKEQSDALAGALSGKKREFDWGEMGSNALKGGLVGAGTGTAVGGWAAGIGTAVGAVIGVAAGALTNAVDQWIENGKYNDLADAANNMSDAFNSLSSAQDSYARTLKKGQESQQAIDLIKQRMTKDGIKLDDLSQDQQIALNEAFAQLQEQFPAQIGNLTSINDLEPRYIEVLQGKIAKEKELAAVELIGAGSESLGSMDDVIKKFNDIAEDEIKSEAALGFVNSVIKTGGENGEQWTSEMIENELEAQIKKNYGVSSEDGEVYSDYRKALIEELNSGESGEIIKFKYNGNGELVQLVLAGQSGGGFTVGDNISQFASDYSESETKRGEAINLLQTLNSDLYEAWQAILRIAESNPALDENGNIIEGEYAFTEDTKLQLKDLINQFNTKVKSVDDEAKKYNLSYYSPSKDLFTDLESIYKSVGVTPGFKVGLNTVPYDDYLARLHKGEMVLTAENADKIRDIASRGSGLSRTLSQLQGLVRATAIGSAQTQSFDVVVTAIQSQTDAIVGALNSIYELLVQNVAPNRSVSRSNTAVIPKVISV